MNRLSYVVKSALVGILLVSNVLAEEVAAAASQGSALFPTSGMLALALGIAAAACGLGQGKALASAFDSIGRNPAVASVLFVPMILGLVFIESLVIFTFVMCILLK